MGCNRAAVEQENGIYYSSLSCDYPDTSLEPDNIHTREPDPMPDMPLSVHSVFLHRQETQPDYPPPEN